MIKVAVMYPNTPNSKFDMAYYCNLHIPMAQGKLGAALKGLSVEAGIGGAEPGSPPPFVAVAHLSFDSVEAFQNAFSTHGEAIFADVPNYTNIRPTIQISEVKI